jgi:hypothetical protein
VGGRLNAGTICHLTHSNELAFVDQTVPISIHCAQQLTNHGLGPAKPQGSATPLEFVRVELTTSIAIPVQALIRLRSTVRGKLLEKHSQLGEYRSRIWPCPVWIPGRAKKLDEATVCRT